MMATSTVLDSNAFAFLQRFVQSRSAIVIDENKSYLIESRLLPLARSAGFATLAELVAALRCGGSGELRQAVIEAMTTHETSFFRDLHPFETLRSTVLPRLLTARRATRTLTVWCAACSTGQEPYTIALLLREHFPELRSWNVRLLATDLSQAILERARQGMFSQTEVNRGLPAALLVKYFRQSGLKWQLNPEVRQMVQFTQLNLAEPWPGWPRCDVIFLRNVLIYFSPETKREILQRVERVLSSDGYLFLGGAETTLNLSDRFTRLTLDRSTCYQPVGGGISRRPPESSLLMEAGTP